MLYSLDGDVAFGNSIDRFPALGREKFFWRIERFFGDDLRSDLALQVQQAARLQHAALSITQAAARGGNSLFFYFDGFFGRVNDRLKLLNLGLQRRIAGSDVIFFRAGDPALAINVIEMTFDALGQNVIERGLLVGSKRLFGDKDQAEHALAQLVDDHGAQRQRVVAGAAIG